MGINIQVIFVLFQAFNQIKPKVKYMITLLILELLICFFLLCFFFLLCIRMSGKSVNFDGKIIKKSEFYKNKKVTKIDDIDVNKILVSKEEHIIQRIRLNTLLDIIRPLCVKLPLMTGYAKKIEFNLTLSFKINNKEFLKKYYQIWIRIGKLLKIKFDSKPIYGDDEKYLKTKIKTYGDSVIANLHSKKIPKEKAPCKC